MVSESKSHCPYCDANVSLSLPRGANFGGATKTKKDAEHEHEETCAMCGDHFYVHYTLN